MNSYVLCMVFACALLVVARAVELYFKDRTAARDKELKISSQLLAGSVELTQRVESLDEHTRSRLDVYERGLTNAIAQFKLIVADTEAERRKAVAGAVANQIRPGLRKPPTP